MMAKKENLLLAEESRKVLAARELAREVKRLREAARWTQAELAERVGISQPGISDMELGRYNFPLESVVRLAKAFGKSPYEFFAIYLGDNPAQFTSVEKELLNDIIEKVVNYLSATGELPGLTGTAPGQVAAPTPIRPFSPDATYKAVSDKALADAKAQAEENKKKSEQVEDKEDCGEAEN